jgi:hypothetical protein
MKWTFKGTKDAFTPNADKITVTEYEFYTDSRGGGSSTTTQYYEGVVPQDKSSYGQYAPPKGKKLKLGEDFTFESPKTNTFKNAKNLFDKLTANPIIIGIVLVAGYFAYKKFKK